MVKVSCGARLVCLSAPAARVQLGFGVSDDDLAAQRAARPGAREVTL